MIKRIAVISLLLMYVSTSVGFAMSLHFCGVKVSNIRINPGSKKPCCSKETESKPDKCCKDKHLNVKVTDSQRIVQPAKVPVASNHDIFLVLQRQFALNSESFLQGSAFRFRGPRVSSPVPLNIQHCNFRI